MKSERSSTDESGEGFRRSGGMNASYTAFAAALPPIASIISTCSSDHSSSVTEMTWCRCSPSKQIYQNFSSYEFIIIFTAKAHLLCSTEWDKRTGSYRQNKLTFETCTPRLRCTPQHFIHKNTPMLVDLHHNIMEVKWIEGNIMQVQLLPSHLCTMQSQNASG